MTTWFISDLHLAGQRPGTLARFQAFLQGEARDADALYILGDLFEAWLGDDLVLPEYEPAVAALHALTASGVPCFVMHGNRDFLLGAQFEAMTGCRLLPDPSVIELYGRATLLLHGDSLCTDDRPYQELRRQVRDPAWKEEFCALPAADRIALARRFREQSRAETSLKEEYLTDVNAVAVLEALSTAKVDRMIHGHTHRPAVHQLSVEGRPAQRIVLGEWGETTQVARCDESGCLLVTLR